MAIKEVRGVLVKVGRPPVEAVLTWDHGADTDASTGFSTAVTKLIGIEKVEPMPFPFIKGVIMMTDEDGRLKGLRYNRVGVVGNFFVCASSHGSFLSLSDADRKEVISSLRNQALIGEYEKALSRYELQRPMENEPLKRKAARERLMKETGGQCVPHPSHEFSE